MPNRLGDSRVLARFENGDAAIIEKLDGQRTARRAGERLATGRQPARPVVEVRAAHVGITGAVETRGRWSRPINVVGDRVPLPVVDDAVKSMIVHKPDGAAVTIARQTAFFDETDQPGVYTLDTPAGASSFAVNLDPLESKTTPLPVETIEQLGVRLANHSRKNVDREQLRQMYNAELEGRQKLWRWLILAVNRHPDLRNLAGGANHRSAPLDPRGGIDDMSTRTPTSIGTGRATIPARAALDWADALLARLGLGRRVPLADRLALGREADSRRVAAGRCSASWWRPGSACAIVALRSVRDSRWVARRIEAKHPELGTGLLAAVEEDAATPSGRLGFLQSAVIRQALDHRRANDWDETVPTWKLRVSQLAHAATLGFLIAVAIALASQARSQAEPRTAILSEASAADVQVDPGNTEIERGTPLLVVARFKGGVPAEASLVVDDQAQKTTHRGMTRSLEDPTFAGHVESVDADLSYRVEFQGKSTRDFSCSRVRISRARAHRRQAGLPAATRRSSPRRSRIFATSRRSRGPS